MANTRVARGHDCERGFLSRILHAGRGDVISVPIESPMPTPQERYDDAMFEFSQVNYEQAIVLLKALLVEHPDHFDAQLALGMASYRLGDYATAIAEGHKAEQLRPKRTPPGRSACSSS